MTKETKVEKRRIDLYTICMLLFVQSFFFSFLACRCFLSGTVQRLNICHKVCVLYFSRNCGLVIFKKLRCAETYLNGECPFDSCPTQSPKFWSMFVFFTPWKHQKTLVFMGYKMRTLARNGLIRKSRGRYNQHKYKFRIHANQIAKQSVLMKP